MRGVEIISSKRTAKRSVLELALLPSQLSEAAESLLGCIGQGCILTLGDNRDSREGAAIVKCADGRLLKREGGHGFELDWKEIDESHFHWLLKVLAPFNIGGPKSGTATLEEERANKGIERKKRPE